MVLRPFSVPGRLRSAGVLSDATAISIVDGREHPFAEFFDSLRETRREKRAAPGTRQRSAVMTMVRDEAVFLPIWLRYYSRFFSPEDIYVLDHGSTDGSTEQGGFVRLPVEHPTIDHAWRLRAVEEQQRRLLERYDVVLAVDVDEIVAPDPDWGTLDDYLAGFQEEFVNCLGYEILHLRDREPPLRPELPVMEQRGYWFAAEGYDKPVLATEPLSWKPGFHSRADERWNLDPDLRLIHLHRVDYEICQQRHRAWRERAWSEQDMSKGWAAHNRIADDEEFDRWFHAGAEGDAEIVIEGIPARWRTIC